MPPSAKPPGGDNPPWQAVSSQEIYTNPWTTVIEEQLVGPQQQPGLYGYFAPVDCVVVVPLWIEGGAWHTALVQQWRQPIREHSWEVPCGRIEPGEDVEATAQRELAEECGFQAGHLVQIGRWRHSDARVAGIIHCCVALDLTSDHSYTKDDTEADLSVFRLRWGDAFAAIDSGAVNQVASMSALLHCTRHATVSTLLSAP
jgi:8-oxo-dGTP pyrophosphatase MutT (NUDIX family)